jgi:type VI secretion system secreted protein Hcp
MAFDSFLKLDGIKGESQDHKHKGEIEVLSFSWGIKQSLSSGSGGGQGKATFNDFSIVKHIDIASPQLMVFCCTGDHIKDGLLTVEEPNRRGGVAFLKIKLTDVLVSSYQTGGGGSEVPTDQVSFNFVKMEIMVRDDNGSWSQGESCAVTRGDEVELKPNQ